MGSPVERGLDARFEVGEALRLDGLGRTFDTTIRGWPGFLGDAIAIAENGGGDLILRGGSEVVEFWDHETGELQPVVVDWR